jgi:hypothetical protein
MRTATPELSSKKAQPKTVPAAVQPVEEKATLSTLGHIQTELTSLVSDFILHGGWNDAILNKFISAEDTRPT